MTAALPARCGYLQELERNVTVIKESARSAGWSVTWHVALDGPGQGPAVGADSITRLAARRGIAAARNAALNSVEANWVIPCDADDLIEVDGTVSLLKRISSIDPVIGWISANRMLPTGQRTAHWRSSETSWQPGQLSENWQTPFPFHPNSIVAETQLVWRCGGWPAVGVNEDMALCLLMSEHKSGLSVTEVLTIYRVWDGQEIAASSYLEDKRVAFESIQHMVNALRRDQGRSAVQRPETGGAYGKIALTLEDKEDTDR